VVDLGTGIEVSIVVSDTRVIGKVEAANSSRCWRVGVSANSGVHDSPYCSVAILGEKSCLCLTKFSV
jgi:hypothetical protein